MENPEIFTNTQKIEISRFVAQLNDQPYFAMFSLTDDMWIVYDTQTTGEICRHEDDGTTIKETGYFDEWLS